MMKNSKLSNAKRNPKDSFLEAFRDIGSDTISSFKDDLFKDGAKDIFNSFSPFGQNSSDQKPNSFDPYAKESGLEKRYQTNVSRLEVVKREEKVLFTREQRETQQQVVSLQQEIQKLAKSVAQLGSEVKEAEITAMQEAPVVGTYHINFFTRLRKKIADITSEIKDSSFWLDSWNKKAQKKNYYWGQFKKSGSKFMLSSDRYVATQAG